MEFDAKSTNFFSRPEMAERLLWTASQGVELEFKSLFGFFNHERMLRLEKISQLPILAIKDENFETLFEFAKRCAQRKLESKLLISFEEREKKWVATKIIIPEYAVFPFHPNLGPEIERLIEIHEKNPNLNPGVIKKPSKSELEATSELDGINRVLAQAFEADPEWQRQFLLENFDSMKKLNLNEAIRLANGKSAEEKTGVFVFHEWEGIEWHGKMHVLKRFYANAIKREIPIGSEKKLSSMSLISPDEELSNEMKLLPKEWEKELKDASQMGRYHIEFIAFNEDNLLEIMPALRLAGLEIPEMWQSFFSAN